MVIDFSELVKDNNLFLDYMYNFENVKRFYRYNFRDEDSFENIFSKLTSKKGTINTDLVEIIKNQYVKFSPSEKTKNNIEALTQSNTITVFTDQPLGLVGTPLYTVYKIFTTIKLSEYLNKKFTDYNFIPIIWLAGEEHYFEEVTNINFIDKENEIKKLFYYDFNNKELNKGSIGNIKFNNYIKELNSEIKTSLRETEFSKSFFKLLDTILVEGITFKESFFKLVFKIFDETGLIIFSPQDAKVKKLLKPIFINELNNFKEHSSDVLLVSADLDENYHAQAKVKPINLFYSNETGRRLIEPVDDEFRLKGKRKRITKKEMLTRIEKNPEYFSPNLLLRTVCRDYLFPTGFYVSGAEEISSFAQATPLYKSFDVQLPIIYPRASATIVESNIAKILMQHNLSVKDFFQEETTLKGSILKTLSADNVETIFNTATQFVEESLTNLTEKLDLIDGPISEETEMNAKKILQQLEAMKLKAIKNEENKYSAALRQLKKAQNVVYPKNNLQEHELSIINFVNKYGMDFFDWLYNELEINEFNHQVLEL